MNILLSAAKSLTPIINHKAKDINRSKPMFMPQTNIIYDYLREKNIGELSKILNVSDNIATKAKTYYERWEKSEDSFAAVLYFFGDVYKALDVQSMNETELTFLNDRLRIISGFYGILRAFDYIKPYRLDMGTKISFANYKSLYEFWSDKVTNYLNEDKSYDTILNLASNEYFKVINLKKLQKNVITPSFKENVNGQLKSKFMYIKKARGAMLRYIIKNNIKHLEGIKRFDLDGYKIDNKLSNHNNLVFVR